MSYTPKISKVLLQAWFQWVSKTPVTQVSQKCLSAGHIHCTTNSTEVQCKFLNFRSHLFRPSVTRSLVKGSKDSQGGFSEIPVRDVGGLEFLESKLFLKIIMNQNWNFHREGGGGGETKSTTIERVLIFSRTLQLEANFSSASKITLCDFLISLPCSFSSYCFIKLQMYVTLRLKWAWVAYMLRLSDCLNVTGYCYAVFLVNKT